MKSKNGKFIKSSPIWLSQEYQEKLLAKHLDKQEKFTKQFTYQVLGIHV